MKWEMSICTLKSIDETTGAFIHKIKPRQSHQEHSRKVSQSIPTFPNVRCHWIMKDFADMNDPARLRARHADLLLGNSYPVTHGEIPSPDGLRYVDNKLRNNGDKLMSSLERAPAT